MTNFIDVRFTLDPGFGYNYRNGTLFANFKGNMNINLLIRVAAVAPCLFDYFDGDDYHNSEIVIESFSNRCFILSSKLGIERCVSSDFVRKL